MEKYITWAYLSGGIWREEMSDSKDFNKLVAVSPKAFFYYKKAIWKYSEKLQENTHVEVWFQ